MKKKANTTTTAENDRRIMTQIENLENAIEALNRRIISLPAGSFVCAGSGKYFRWYRCRNGSAEYISKKNVSLAEKLALRSYLETRKANLERELGGLYAARTYLDRHPLLSEAGFGEAPLRDLLAAAYTPLDEELRVWQNADFPHNPLHPEALIHRSVSGHLLRSKSEAMIDAALFRHRLAFRYECLLSLPEGDFYPDFTIRHPKTGEIILWEHFGLMDNPLYVQKACRKLQIYLTGGYVPTRSLITSYETADHPLCMDEIEALIDRTFFL